jgi:Pyruvate/2-oxoacid:ferredoxin oxidoreductase gamma subunit
MAGAYSKFSKLFDFESLKKALPELIPQNKKDMLEINMTAMEKGYQYVEEKKYMFGRYVYSVFKGI